MEHRLESMIIRAVGVDVERALSCVNELELELPSRYIVFFHQGIHVISQKIFTEIQTEIQSNGSIAIRRRRNLEDAEGLGGPPCSKDVSENFSNCALIFHVSNGFLNRESFEYLQFK